MKKHALILGFALLAASPSFADNMPVNADGLTWGPAPPVLPKGAQIAVLSGDPSKDGLYVLRLKMPANYKIPAHNHPTAEYVTIISGKFHIGMGDKLDEKKGSNSALEALVRRPRTWITMLGHQRTPWSKYTVKALLR
jgi:hypothetical protein